MKVVGVRCRQRSSKEREWDKGLVRIRGKRIEKERRESDREREEAMLEVEA